MPVTTNDNATLDFSKMDGWGWAKLLEEHPEYADKCKWSKLDGWPWVRLLKAQPQFAGKCAWRKLSLDQVADLVACRPDLTALAKEKKGIRGKLLDLSIQSQSRTAEIGCMELSKYRKQFMQGGRLRRALDKYYGAIECVPLSMEFDESDYFMVLSYSDSNEEQDWCNLEISVKLDGETVFQECVSPGDPHGIVFRKRKIPFKLNFGDGTKEWAVGVEYWSGVLRVTCIKDVPSDFHFTPSRLTIPYFSMPIGYWGPSLIVNGCAIRYKDLAPDDLLSDCDPDISKGKNYLLLSRDGMRPFPERMTGCDWANLLSHSPQFADHCDWSKLDEYGGAYWRDLLEAQPQFADKCDWSKLDSRNLEELLAARPQLAKFMPGGCGKKAAFGKKGNTPASDFPASAAKSPVAALIESMQPIPGQDYALCKFEVSQALWKTVTGDNPSKFKGKDRPVERVSWDDCRKFLDRLNAMPEVKASGRPFRLPTWEEWDFANRAGSLGRFSFEPNSFSAHVSGASLCDVAWLKGNSDGRTHPVGQKEPNAFGLYDMEGNVAEFITTGGKRGFDICGTSWQDADVNYGFHVDPWAFRPDQDTVPDSEYARDNWGFRLARDLFATEKERKCRVAARIAADMVPIPGKDFAVGRFTVTQSVWKAVMGKWPADQAETGFDLPVSNISWNDCQKFLKALNEIPDVKASGRLYRLPSAAEWFFACLAGADKRGHCRLADGTDIDRNTLERVAWIDKSSSWRIRPVGLKEPNAFGLFDMIGNVWEWTATAKGSDYSVRGPTANPENAYEAKWGLMVPPDTKDNQLGFRLAR